MNVSIYRNAKDNKGAVTDITNVLIDIREGTYREYVKALREMSKEEYDEQKKIILPAVTFSGVFQPKRQIENCTEYNMIVTVDIDNIDPMELLDTAEKLKADPHVLCLFVSPSGEGLKLLITVDSGKENHLEAFLSIEAYFKTIHDITIDPSGKDPCRLCFVSHDPELYYNGEATRFHVEVSEEARKRVYEDRELAYGSNSITSDDNEIFRVCKEWADYYKPYKEGGRNAHVHKLSCDLNRCGVDVENAIIMMARTYTDLSVQEIKDTARKVWKANAGEHDTQTVYDFNNQQDAMRGSMDFLTADELMSEVMEKPDGDLVTTGNPARDAVFGGGLARGNVYAYVGREKTFKSVDAIKTAIHLAKQKKPVLYLCGEMSKRQFLMIVAQQELGISRKDFNNHLNEILEYMKTHLRYLCVVCGKGFTKDGIVKTCNSIFKMFSVFVELVIVDGLTHMLWPTREEISSQIQNSIECKEIAKDCNDGHMVPIIVLIHTNSESQMWNRGPQAYVRGGMKVMSNMDGSVGFSKFIEPESLKLKESSPTFRNDVYHVRVEDYRMTGDVMDIVMELNANVKPSESTTDPSFYEITTA